MDDKIIPIDAGLTNPNLDIVHQLFYQRVSKYFDVNDSPKSEYFEKVNCYNCGSKAIASDFVIARFRHVRCAQCGMVYVSPRIKEMVLHDSYDEEDYACYPDTDITQQTSNVWFQSGC